MPADRNIPPPGPLPKPVNWHLASLCVVLGLVCLAFPYLGHWINPKVSSPVVTLFSFSAAFGMFLTAVGGWASGKWRGWTFGGAAATVVALFFVMAWFKTDGNQNGPHGLIAKITSPSLYSDITALEAMEEGGARLFVAPNRKLKHADVLIEPANLKTECLAFIFAPKTDTGATQGEAETIDLKVPSKIFSQELDVSSDGNRSRKQIRLHYHHASQSILRQPPTAGAAPEPVTGPGICSHLSAGPTIAMSKSTSLFGWISHAFAADQNVGGLITELNSGDAFTRRDAREQLAIAGPKTVPDLLRAIPQETSPSHYRFALGAATAVAKMAVSETQRAAVREAMTEEDLETLVKLMAHPDKTMQEWATRAVIGIQDTRSVNPLIDMLADNRVAQSGKYNAALALRDTASSYQPETQKIIMNAVPSLKPNLNAQTVKLLDQLPTAQATATKTGWVYIGARFGRDWSEHHFNWSNENAALPANGSSIKATGDVNVRSDPIRFTLDKGWINSPIIGLVRKGQKVKLLEVKEVTKGFFWAKVDLS